ncbi:MAG: GNAT family N-acetyltransferase [Flavobacteriales bacterium]|nr:GNAT family N-acetyltransferase [Flavobacteriales bacterium]
MNIRLATQADVSRIRLVALRTWPVAYARILSPSQLTYMLDLMYSERALAAQMSVRNHRFALCSEGDELLGFAGYEHHYGRPGHTRLHKLYALPEAQGSGVGRTLLLHVMDEARGAGDHRVELNVNRFNTARPFYEKHGFRVVRDEVIDIGKGYVMDDHVMELDLSHGPEEHLA